jgi:hypothetical protein
LADSLEQNSSLAWKKSFDSIARGVESERVLSKAAHPANEMRTEKSKKRF